MLSLSTKSHSMTIHSDQQKICIVTHPALFSKAGTTQVVFFEDIEQVHLNHWEHGYTVKVVDQYSTYEDPWFWQRWAIELTLKDGRTLTIGEETSDHRADDTQAATRQRAYWESLADTVSKVLGKPLAAMPTVRDSPRTFVQAIDQILQDRLKKSGRNNASVNIHSSKDLGIEIVVNGKAYTAMEEVEDEVIRCLIQDSIREWQNGNK